MISKLGGRKLLVVIVFAVAGVVIDLCTERGLSANLKELLMALGGAFGLFNVGSKLATKQKQETPPVDISQLEQFIEHKFADLSFTLDEKLKPTETPAEVMNYLKAIQNGQVAQTEAIKAQAQLSAQTHQIIVAAVQGQK